VGYFNLRGFLFRNYLLLFFVFLISWLIIAILLKIYRIPFLSKHSYSRIILLDFINLFVIGTFSFYYNKTYSFSRAFLILATAILVSLHFFMRWMYSSIKLRNVRMRYLQQKKRPLVFLSNLQKRYQVVLLILDLIIINASFIFAFYLRFDTNLLPAVHKTAIFSEQLYKLWFLTAIFILFNFVYNLYRVDYKGKLDVIGSVFKSNIVSILVIVFITYFSNTRYKYEWTGVIELAAVEIFIFMSILRYYIGNLYDAQKRHIDENILIIGAGKTGAIICDRIKRARKYQKHIIGFLDDNEYLQGKEIQGILVLGGIEKLAEILDKNKEINSVIIAIPSIKKEKLSDIINICNRRLIPFKLTSEIFSIIMSKLEVEEYEGFMFMQLKHSPLERNINRFIKRLFDILFSAFFIIVLSPVFIVFSIIIKLTSAGPVFYRQKRLGENRREFFALKFRSMYVNKISDEPWTNAADPRITKIGKFLRRYSLDELPQLFNILKGDMSIVGPRALASEDEQYFDSPFFRLRYKAKAGLTGWAQVHGLRGGHRFIEERTRFDLWYIENWTLLLDVKIIFMTVGEVFFGSNAY